MAIRSHEAIGQFNDVFRPQQGSFIYGGDCPRRVFSNRGSDVIAEFFTQGTAAMATLHMCNMLRDLKKNWYGYKQLAVASDELVSLTVNLLSPGIIKMARHSIQFEEPRCIEYTYPA